jgi:hypothetical protein
VRDVRVGAAQFEQRDGDKAHNLASRSQNKYQRHDLKSISLNSFERCAIARRPTKPGEIAATGGL